MNNLTDHNRRTIWFAGEAGPMVPKNAKQVGRKGGTGSKVPKSGSGKDDVKKENEESPKKVKDEPDKKNKKKIKKEPEEIEPSSMEKEKEDKVKKESKQKTSNVKEEPKDEN